MNDKLDQEFGIAGRSAMVYTNDGSLEPLTESEIMEHSEANVTPTAAAVGKRHSMSKLVFINKPTS